jgi:hypothetical protein
MGNGKPFTIPVKCPFSGFGVKDVEPSNISSEHFVC